LYTSRRFFLHLRCLAFVSSDIPSL
jgi:hypothetical protein